MNYPTTFGAYWVVALIGCTLSSPVAANDPQVLLREAELACVGIKDLNERDQSLLRLHTIYLQRDEIAKAQKVSLLIKDTRRRVAAHVAIARRFAEAGDLERCKTELYRATPFAVETRASGDQLMDAYLELTKSPELVISFMSDDPDNAEARESLCRALARHGFIDKALEIAESQVDVDEQNSLKLTAALAAARAARSADTEKAIKDLEARRPVLQKVWTALVSALYDKGDLESARMYVDLVNDGQLKRKVEAPPGAKDNRPLNHDELQAFENSSKNTGPFTIPIRSEDPDEANQLLERIIAQAEKNPVKPTNGQFGAWNQEFQLARFRVQYVLVAELYRKAGDQEQATSKMKIAEEAIRLLFQKENGFGTLFAIGELQAPLIYFKNPKELRRLAESTKIPLYSWAADVVVCDMVSSGEFEAAKELATTTLARDSSFFDLTSGDRSKIVACFVEAGKLNLAKEILESSNPSRFAANACENAGRAIAQRDPDLLRQPEWNSALGAFQRTHLLIGAASEFQETRGTEQQNPAQ